MGWWQFRALKHRRQDGRQQGDDDGAGSRKHGAKLRKHFHTEDESGNCAVKAGLAVLASRALILSPPLLNTDGSCRSRCWRKHSPNCVRVSARRPGKPKPSVERGNSKGAVYQYNPTRSSNSLLLSPMLEHIDRRHMPGFDKIRSWLGGGSSPEDGSEGGRAQTPTSTAEPPREDARPAGEPAQAGARDARSVTSDGTVPAHPAPIIPNLRLLRCIGRGAYGEVWLARNEIAVYLAVKLVYRDSFTDRGPYEREYRGILHYTPLSRTHHGLVQILHVGRGQEAGFFYYVMELADCAVAGRDIDTDFYVPRTLAHELDTRGRLPVR